MICPKCYSKTRIVDVRNNFDENEVYRHHLCTNEECRNKFYSVEFVAEENESFKEQYKHASKGGR